MLKLYRRHRKDCSHRGEGRGYRRCACPVWVDGTFNGEEIRASLRTLGRDLPGFEEWEHRQTWESAEELFETWKEGARDSAESAPRPEPVTIEQACADFLRDSEARNLRPSTLYKYRLLFVQMERFAADKGLRSVLEFDLPMLRAFRSSWTNRNFSARKKLECLRTFFRFAQASGWVESNPATKLESPKVNQPPVLPFTREEWIRILAACDVYADNHGRAGREDARRLRAFVLLLRYSGIRIGDAVALSRDRVADAKLFLYTAKTGTAVWCPLPPFVVEALDAAPRTSVSYFFWTGGSKLKSAVGDWQRSLGKLFRLAKVEHGHAHRFRHTFAVELLLAGTPMEHVSMLLGHSSLRVTERHYAAWVRARQEQLEADVRRSWAGETGLVSDDLAETKGTFRVHGDARLVQ